MFRKSIIVNRIVGGLVVALSCGVCVVSAGAATGAFSLTDESTRCTCSFYNYDDALLYRCYVQPSHEAIYKGDLPTKADSETYSYEFSGWDKSLYGIEKDTSFYAQYNEIKKDYVVTFVNYDGTVLQESWVSARTVPHYDGVTPTKEPSNNYQFVFKGWDKPLTQVVADTVFTAQYDQIEQFFEVKFVNYDKSLLYECEVGYYGEAIYQGEEPIGPGLAKDGQREVFDGWDKPTAHITEDTTFTAQYRYEDIKYLVKFLNYDSTLLYTDEVLYKDTAVYGGELPYREPAADCSYVFKGWDKSLEGITSDLEVYALFDEVTPTCTVDFRNDKGESLTKVDVEFGCNAEYPSDLPLPTKEEDDCYTYDFIGWDRDLTNVKESFFTVALFDKIPKKFTVTFLNYDETYIDEIEVEYGCEAIYEGETPVRPEDENYIYEFKGWNEDLTYITSDVFAVAEFRSIPKKEVPGQEEGESGGSGEGSGGGGSGGSGGGSSEGQDKANSVCVVYKDWDARASISDYLDIDTCVINGRTRYSPRKELPTRPDDKKYSGYAFDSWDKQSSFDCVKKGFNTYAQYHIGEGYSRKYIVTFRNDDESLLYECVCEPYDMPYYAPKCDPVSYYNGTTSAFVGWDRELVMVTNYSYTLYAKYKTVEGAAAFSDVEQDPFDQEESNNVFTYQTSYGGNVYFREKSFGNLDKNHWNEAGKYTDYNSLSPLYFTSDKISHTSLHSASISITYEKEHLYPITPQYVKNPLPTTQTDVYGKYNSDLDYTYDYAPFTASTGIINQLKNASYSNTSVSTDESNYYNYVKKTYLSVNAKEKDFLGQFINTYNLKATSIADILHVVSFLNKYATFNKNMTAYPDKQDNVIYFLETAKEGYAPHFASALTLIYRTLNIPARYVVGYVSKSTADTNMAVTNLDSHAWTEIYLPSIGWVSLDATPVMEQKEDANPYNPFGPVIGTPEIIITVSPNSSSKVYDGSIMPVSASITKGSLDCGDYIEFNVCEEGSLAGNYVTRCRPRIFDSLGNDVTENYVGRVKINFASYKITRRSITIQTGSAEKYRDGEELICHVLNIISGEFAYGDAWSNVIFTGSQSEPGESTNTIDTNSFVILNNKGVDVTNSYSITWVFGKLTVK